MEQKPPSFIPPKVAYVLGLVAVGAASFAPMMPDVAKPFLELGAFVLSFLAGIALPQLKLTAGKGVVTGAAVTPLAGGAVVLEQLSQAVPAAYQPLAYAGAALLAILAGKALPSFAPAQQAGLRAVENPGAGVDA